MSNYRLKITLKSDASFGRGDGVAGLVDVEAQHDEWGLPFLGGRAIKGILVEECADILHSLPTKLKKHWSEVAQMLFGQPGSLAADEARLFIGNACLPTDLCAVIAYEVQSEQMSREDVLETFTALRKQTAMDADGVAKDHSLRSIRVVMRETCLEAPLRLTDLESSEQTADALALLSACVHAFRRAGTGRNRGRGLLVAELLDAAGQPIAADPFDHFCQEVLA